MPVPSFPFQTPPPLPTCGVCGGALRGETLNTGLPAPCPACGAQGVAWVFPALFRPVPAGVTGEDLSEVNGEGEAACFFHARKRATVPCDRCGRFLCRLCDLDFGDGRHLCPECLRAGRAERAMPELVNGRPVRDWVALVLTFLGALWVVFLPWLTLGWGVFVGLLSLLPAAAGLFLGVRHSGDVRRGPVVLVGPRVRYGVALFLGLGTVLAWGGWAAYHMAYGFD